MMKSTCVVAAVLGTDALRTNTAKKAMKKAAGMAALAPGMVFGQGDANDPIAVECPMDGNNLIITEATVGDQAWCNNARVEGDIIVEGTDLSVVNLPDLEFLGGKIRVANNDNLAFFEAAKVTTTGALEIENNPAMGEFNINKVESINGSINLENNPVLGTFEPGENEGAPTLQLVDGNINVKNSVFEGQVFIPAPTINGDITIEECPTLPIALFCFDPEFCRNDGTISGNVNIKNNPGLAELTIAPSTIGGALEVENNPELLTAFLRSDTIGAAATFKNNDKCDALELSARTIGGDVVVDDNDVLRFVEIAVSDGDEAISVQGITVTNNPVLQELAVASARDFATQPGITANINGDVLIQNNFAAGSAVGDNIMNLGFVDGEKTIAGSVTVQDNSAMLTLNVFPSDITGDVTVSGNPRLGLTRIGNEAGEGTIGGNLNIVDNNGVALGEGEFPTFEVFAGTLAGDVDFRNNDRFIYLGLENVETLKNLNIENNAALGNFNLGFRRSEAYINLDGSVNVKNNAALTAGFLQSVADITGSVDVEDNANLCEFYVGNYLFADNGDIIGNVGVKSIGGDFIVKNNYKTSSCPNEDENGVVVSPYALYQNVLESVGGSVVIENNDDVQFLLSPELKSVGADYSLTGSPSVDRVSLDSLENVGGDVNVNNNNGLINFSFGFDRNPETDVAGSITVTNNPVLQQIAMVSLRNGVNGINFSNNAAMDNFFLNNLNAVNGDITVENNPFLRGVASFNNFFSLAEVDGNIAFKNNDEAKEFFLNTLTRVGGNVEITDNDTLGTFGAQNLENLGGSLNVMNNPVVGNIGFQGLESNSTDLNFAGNGEGCNLLFKDFASESCAGASN
jgi:hypothetical protein